ARRRPDPTPGGPAPARRGAGERLAEERFSEQERLRLGALEQMRQAEQR
ncbi:lipase chaperone, partial [Pseudomonas aeruginosa]|nr:lipase chaperone [Pseudomonas aeruginosa]